MSVCAEESGHPAIPTRAYNNAPRVDAAQSRPTNPSGALLSSFTTETQPNWGAKFFTFSHSEIYTQENTGELQMGFFFVYIRCSCCLSAFLILY